MIAPVAEFAGKRVLLVEDESILAMSVEDLLADMGCAVVGPALTLADAERLARSEPLDAAMLDINMGEGPSFVIADLLAERGVPFCFSTGYGSAGLPDGFRAIPVLQKPYTGEALEMMIRRLIGS